MTNKKNIIDTIKSSPSNYVKLAVTDIDGVLRGKMMHKEKFLLAAESNFGFCDVVFGWDMMDTAYDNGKVTGWHSGYPDAKARIDLSTLRFMPWEGDVPMILADFKNSNSPHADICPRNLLSKIASKSDSMGFETVFSQELEWFNYKKITENDSLQTKPLTQGMFGYSMLRLSENNAFFNDLFEMLLRFKIPLEGLHTETGPGVMEAAIKYADILEAGDRATLFKTATKQIALTHNIMASFMAKPSNDLPGCGGHIHQSLWKDGKNAFFDASQPNQISETMSSYVAGQLHCLPHILPMFAPTVNSYKRFVEGSWAPTSVNWGIDNRTTALRVVGNNPASMRLETRSIGSDVNPYLALAACLASGLYGIEHQLELTQEAVSGNAYSQSEQRYLPRNLYEANLEMSRSKVANQLFGSAFVDHFTRSRFWEWQQFMNSVTDWESKRYFEII